MRLDNEHDYNDNDDTDDTYNDTNNNDDTDDTYNNSDNDNNDGYNDNGHNNVNACCNMWLDNYMPMPVPMPKTVCRASS